MTFAVEAPRTGWLHNTVATSPWLSVFFVTALSFLFSGYVPLYNNNIYHVAILQRAYDLPQFGDDAYTQSLRYFSSGFWLLFQGAGNVVSPELFLTVWLFLTHLAFLASALHFAISLGCRDNRILNLFVLFLGIAPLSVGETIGGGGLMLNYFSHSELANASLILGLSFALRGRYLPAAIATCLTFFLNAFMAVWMVAPLAVLACYQLIAGRIEPGRFLRDGIAGSLCGVVFLVPPVLNIVHNPDAAGGLAFSYRGFLWDYFPLHFFTWSLASSSLVKLAVIFVVLVLTAVQYGAQCKPFLMLVIGAALLLGIGTLVPLATDSRMILNLHLIRGAAVAVILADITVSLVAATWLIAPASPVQRCLGALIAGLFITSNPALTLSIPVLLFERFSGRISAPLLRYFEGKWLQRAFLGFLAVCVLLLPLRAEKAIAESYAITRQVTLWKNIGAWANGATPANATFLLLPDDDKVPEVGFSYASMRRIWVGWKYGAAVMWSPSYFATWKDRKSVLETVQTPADKFAFARAKGIDYLAMQCAGDLQQTPVHREGDICVYKP